MKKYIFFTMNIGGINGAEQYIYNKLNYLQQNDYEVFIFSGRPGEILIDGFRKYERLIHPALRFYPSALGVREYKNVMDWICSVVDVQPGDTCTIESSNVISSLWGEAVAEKLGCRHFAINLTEHHNCDRGVRSFLEFKLQRHELAGIFDDSVKTMLKQPELPLRPDMRVRAYCSNVVQDCEDRFSCFFDADADYTFGSIGRLEKEYVPMLIEQLVTYFDRHSEKRYNLLLIGGCADKRRLAWIKEKIGTCPNVNLVLTGAMYPISRQLVKKATLFISASGSATASYYEEVPTVSIMHTSAEPKGIIGYDYQLRDRPPVCPLKDRTLLDCIDQILDQTVQISYIEDPHRTFQEKMEAEFLRQQDFGSECQDLAYYDVHNVRYTAVMYRLCSIVCRLAGAKVAYSTLEFIRKLVRGSDR